VEINLKFKQNKLHYFFLFILSNIKIKKNLVPTTRIIIINPKKLIV